MNRGSFGFEVPAASVLDADLRRGITFNSHRDDEPRFFLDLSMASGLEHRGFALS